MGRVHPTKENMMAMRKLMVQQWVTVDNIAAEEDGWLSFVCQGSLFRACLSGDKGDN